MSAPLASQSKGVVFGQICRIRVSMRPFGIGGLLGRPLQLTAGGVHSTPNSSGPRSATYLLGRLVPLSGLVLRSAGGWPGPLPILRVRGSLWRVPPLMTGFPLGAISVITSSQGLGT